MSNKWYWVSMYFLAIFCLLDYIFGEMAILYPSFNWFILSYLNTVGAQIYFLACGYSVVPAICWKLFLHWIVVALLLKIGWPNV